jgi:transposase
MGNVEGLTITEMAKKLGISYGTAKSRLVRAGVKPITKEALYDKSAFEILKNTAGKGRPRKNLPSENDTGEEI